MSADLLTRKAAIVSPCGAYRYELTREWEASLLKLPFVMLNPSTADAELDDPTIRRCMGFARREGFGGIAVVNRFAFRATKPAALFTAKDPFGPDNTEALTKAGRYSAEHGVPLVCAWGAFDGIGTDAVLHLLRGLDARLVCLGRTKDGHPRHPLYVRADQPLEEFA